MIYTEEMKHQINAAGFQVIEFKRLVKRLNLVLERTVIAIKKTLEIMSEMISRAADILKKLFDGTFVLELNHQLRKMPPRQRYKFCRKLGIANYQCFFQHRHVYRARSCC